MLVNIAYLAYKKKTNHLANFGKIWKKGALKARLVNMTHWHRKRSKHLQTWTKI